MGGIQSIFAAERGGDSYKSMFAASRDGDLHSLKKCVEQLSKYKARRLTSVANVGGLTPLVIACRNGHLEVVEYLIDECGADIELRGMMKAGAMEVPPAPPLWWAAAGGHLNVVKCLLSRGANINSVSPSGRCALYEACWNGDLEMVKYLVANGADIEAADINGRTGLFVAYLKEHYHVASYLIETDVNGRLILKSPHLLAKMFNEMLSKGVKVDFEVIMAVFVLVVNDTESRTECCGNNDNFKDEVVPDLIGCITLMQPELSEEQKKSFGEVVRRYVSLDRVEQNSWSPLHSICCAYALGDTEGCPYSVVDVVRQLLDAGADPQAVDRRLETPLHVLAVAGTINLDLIRLLLERGAHFDARNADGKCFLDRVAPEDRAQLNSFDYTTLKCLAARAVKESKIQHQLPSPLADFVKLH